MVVTNKSSRPLSGDFGKPAALAPWKYIHDILIHSIIFGQKIRNDIWYFIPLPLYDTMTIMLLARA